METHPDSALMMLRLIDKSELNSKKEQARYALLMSMALDKNYIDTTSFDILQPAIDYYIENGTPDEKLRTYYYQGVIYHNRGDRENALNSYYKGLDMSHKCSDSLTIARALVAQSLIYNSFYDFDSYISCNLTAANIFKKLGRRRYEIECLLNTLTGAILTENKSLGDDILTYLQTFQSMDNDQKRALTRRKISMAIKFGSKDEIKNLISLQELNLSSQNDVLNLALAYTKIGEHEKCLQLLDSLKSERAPYDTLRLLSISEPAYEGLGKYDAALSHYKLFSQIQDSINLIKFKQKSQTIEEKHQLELKGQRDAQLKSRIIWGCAGGIAVLAMGIGILFLLVGSNKAKKELALEKVRTRESENARLKSEKDNLAMENKNLQLERDMKALEAENLSHRVTALENESECLKALIGDKRELPLEVQNEIKVRIEMLNSLLASYITNNNQFEKSYDIWIKEITDNKVKFMNSNRLAFQVSHPRFIQYFEDHGLTINEINYVCLYAIGLRGKDVGNYINKPGHVNTSSAIRKKLGIDKHETNIGIYVRKLLKSL
ncbi:MAG: hypothetical protein K2M79_04595 [Muribaculaceae bacterium]|nr:hypothetical protein [Muribaculaceae bacterium]